MVTLPFEPHLLFSPEDDALHVPGPEPDWTETSWWSFNVPDRAVAGWLYVQVRPNLKTVAGGAFVYDRRAHLPWELPYFAMFAHHPLPDALDLRSVTLKSGVSIRCVEPGMRYALGYRFRDHTDFLADLEFEGLTPPVPYLKGAPPFVGGSSHFDQHGRVTGTLSLRGEEIDVDCFAVRDRSWGRRPELAGRRSRLSYCFGTSSSTDGFLAFCRPTDDDPLADVEHLGSGYLLRDGVLRRLADGTRVATRDPSTGAVSTIELAATDEDGRALAVAGDAVSRMFLPNNHLCINTLVRWDGGAAWGEDQDVWPVALFSDRRIHAALRDH